MRELTFGRQVQCVSDSYSFVSIPEQMFPYPADRNKSMDMIENHRQMRGSVLERLAELAGRVCYDSLGNGRNSEDFHRHIHEVGHFSIYEHCMRKMYLHEVSIALSPDRLFNEMLFFHNKPGLRIKVSGSATGAISVCVTFNLRHAIEYCLGTGPFSDGVRSSIFSTMVNFDIEMVRNIPAIMDSAQRLRSEVLKVPVHETNPEWLSYYLKGSRGFSHELIRHGDFTAVSQRSTRYVDEADSIDCWHPLMRNISTDLMGSVLDHASKSRKLYLLIASELGSLGIERKQYRGAARGVLPTALSTEMIFSAATDGPDQWKHIAEMRCDPMADEEISQIIHNVRE